MSTEIRVARLASTPVKGTRIMPRSSLRLGPAGAEDDRRFYVVDDRGRMVSGKQIGSLCAVVAAYDRPSRVLTLTLPGAAGATVAGTVSLGAEIATRFFSRPARARLVEGGSWSAALSSFCGRPLRLVAPADGWLGVDRGRAGGVSLVSSASVARLAAESDASEVDARRFRMLIELSGIAAHTEDGWPGRSLRVGEALIRVAGHVGRCLVTTRDPDTGQVDLPVLDLLRTYRAGLDTTEPLALGVYGAVIEPGLVRVGARVELV